MKQKIAPEIFRRLFYAVVLAIFGLFLNALSAQQSSASSVSNHAKLQASPTITTAYTPTPIAHTESWRLPFDGQRRIWNGPGESRHTGNSSEAVDFTLGVFPGQEFPIYAVADGIVVDLVEDTAPNGWGWVLRINHPTLNPISCSFYAHLKPNSSPFSAPFGQPVKQGEFIGTAGMSGGGANGENHLHFEARIPLCQAGAGNVNTGTSIPILALMGNWWNPQYAPPPFLTLQPTKLSNSGRAEYPVNATPPTEMWVSTPGPRHLSNLQSPSNFPSAYISNITTSQAVLHLGANPDVPTNDAYFQVKGFYNNLWNVLGNGINGPTYTTTLGANNRCGSNGQYCYGVRVAPAGGQFTANPRYVDVHPGNVAVPYISASYNFNEATVTLGYNFPGALRYRVYEFHGGETFFVYEGNATQITVNRITGAPINAYTVTVDLGIAGWTQSAWLYLHNETVSIPTATATLLPTPVPTATLEPPIFADGFETGNFSRWTSNVNDVGDLSVSTQAAMVSTYGMKAVIDDNNSIYVRDDTPNASLLYRARFYFDPNSIPMANGNMHYVFYGLNASSTVVLRVEFGKTTVYQMRAGLLNDTSTGWTTSSWFTITDAPHFIEFYWRASSAPLANNGGLTFWIDGVQKADITGIDNDMRRIDSVRLGAVGGVDTGTRGTYYFDAFESHLTTYIGPALREGLMAYWKLEEANSIRFDSVNDQTPANNLNDFNTVGQSLGKVGNAAQFLATNSEYLSVPDNADLSTGNIDFTIAAWVYLDSKSDNRVIGGKWGPTGGGQMEYLLMYEVEWYTDRFLFTVSPDSLIQTNCIAHFEVRQKPK